MSVFRLSFGLTDVLGGVMHSADNSAIARKLSLRRNVPATATVKVPIEDPAATALFPGLGRLKVWRSRTAAELASDPALGRVLVFYGQLPPTGITHDTYVGTSEGIYQDPRWRLNHMYLPAAYTATATGQGAILWAQITTQMARPGGSLLGMVQGQTDNSVLRDRAYDRGKSVAELVDEMTKVIGGPDVDFNPSETLGASFLGTFSSYARQGIDQPNAVFSHGPGLPTNFAGSEVQYGQATTAAAVQATGGNGADTFQAYSNAVASGLGLIEEFINESDAMTAATALSKAQGRVLENQTPRLLLKLKGITSEAPVPFVQYGLGDTVRVTDRRGAIRLDRAVARVEGIELEADVNGEVVVTELTVSVL